MPSHEKVQNYIVEYMRGIEWSVEVDEFEYETPSFGRQRDRDVDPGGGTVPRAGLPLRQQVLQESVEVGGEKGRHQSQSAVGVFDGEETFQNWESKEHDTWIAH